MKKWILILLLIPSMALANYLAADKPAFTPIICEVSINGEVQAANCIVDGSNIKLLDLTGFAPGPYTFKARWKIKADGQWSEWSLPFDDEKPGRPGGLKVVD